MPIATTQKAQNWWNVKGKIIRKFGSLARFAAHLDCSVEAIRQSQDGKCPGVAKKVEAALR